MSKVIYNTVTFTLPKWNYLTNGHINLKRVSLCVVFCVWALKLISLESIFVHEEAEGVFHTVAMPGNPAN